MGILVFFVFLLIWVLPLFLKQRKSGFVSWKRILIAVAMGLAPATAVLLLLQFALGWILKFLNISEYPQIYNFVTSFITAACIEEFTKYYFADKVMQKQYAYKKIDCMMLFGAVGLGYEIVESLMMGVTNPLAAVVRGAFAGHVMYQFIMASHYFEYKKAQQQGNERRAKWQKFLMFFVPIAAHGLNDYIITFAPSTDIEDSIAQSLAVILLVVLLNLVVLIIGLFKAYRSMKDETVIKNEEKKQTKKDTRNLRKTERLYQSALVHRRRFFRRELPAARISSHACGH